ncbi:MAG: cobalamin-binding protein [Desulfomonilaceae bacterium]|nr:cobalamin-binding protein [Desulfomonilaceae bacterium]
MQCPENSRGVSNRSSERRFHLEIVVFTVMLWCAGLLISHPAGANCVQDDLERMVCIGPSVSRIVSFAPSLTEIVFALGHGDHLVGRSNFCDYPAEATRVPIVGSYTRPALERVIALKPDLVLTTKDAAQKGLVVKLEGLGIPVFVSRTLKMDEIFDLVKRIGRLLGDEDVAMALVEDLQKRRSAVKNRLKGVGKPTALLVVGLKPLFVAGGQSFVGSVLREAKCVNIAEDVILDYPKYSIEEVIRRDPDIILVLNKECSSHESCFGPWKRYPSLSAVKSGRVYKVNADSLARPGPRIIDGLEALADILHPNESASHPTGGRPVTTRRR